MGFLRATMLYIERICYGNPSVCLSICLSHACIVSKRLNIIEILSLSDRSIILVFRHQGLWRKSDGLTPTGAPNTTVIETERLVLYTRPAVCIEVCKHVHGRP